MNRAPRHLMPGIVFLCLALGMAGGFANEEREEEMDPDELWEKWLEMESAGELGATELDELLAPPPLWDTHSTLRFGAGYRDNVMLSAFDQQSSGFLLGGFDGTIARMPPEGAELVFAMDVEHLHFLADRDIDDDTLASLFGRVRVPVFQDSKLALATTAYYLDQVIDPSTTVEVIDPIPVRGHGVILSPSLQTEWGWARSELTARAGRHQFKTPLHDFWEIGPEVSVSREVGAGNLSLALSYLTRRYDDRPARTREGEIIEGSDVRLRIIRPELSYELRWGAAGQWRSQTRVRMSFTRDRENGYFSYNQPNVSQQLQYRNEPWEVRTYLRYTYFDYRIQRTADGDRRSRSTLSPGLEVRYQLSESINLFARYDRERIRSNEAEAEYSVNTVAAGFGWNF